jgi:hypothetical protein
MVIDDNGIVSVKIYRHNDDPRSIYLYGLSVKPEYEYTKVVFKLLDKIKDILVKLGMTDKMYVSVDKTSLDNYYVYDSYVAERGYAYIGDNTYEENHVWMLLDFKN